MRRLKREYGKTSYWKSMTDVLSALLLVLILLLILFMFNAVTQDEPEQDAEGYEDFDAMGGLGVDDTDGEETSPADSQSGGGGGEEPEEETTEATEAPKEDDGKSAVLVVIRDVDTQRNITEEGIRFELREEDGSLLALSTYYPKQVTYQDYATQADGTFFLPEKIAFGSYRLNNMTAPSGYELASPLTFGVHDSYDWPSPYIVVVHFGPEKNAIFIQEVSEDGRSLSHSSEYEVYANRDIITADGTVRFHQGELVTSFFTNSHGYGMSEEVYLGDYRLVQIVSEEGYAINADTIVTVSSKRSENTNQLNHVVCEKTRISVQLVDELDEGFRLSGAVYEVTNSTDQNVVTITTNASGYAQVENLKKDTHYYVTQISSSARHFKDDHIYDFYVDQNGLIDGKASAELNHTNRITKLEISVVDQVLRRRLSGYEVEVFNSEGDLETHFISSGSAFSLDGLAPGRYRLVCNGAQTVDVHVADTASVQYAVITVRTQTWMVLAAIGAALLLTAGWLLLRGIQKKRRQSGGTEINS